MNSSSNPYLEKQTILLSRLVKTLDRCNEAVVDLNGHIQDVVSNPDSETVIITAKLFEKYERNVAYNLPHLISDESRAGSGEGTGSRLAGEPRKLQMTCYLPWLGFWPSPCEEIGDTVIDTISNSLSNYCGGQPRCRIDS
ncbi:DASH complex subunit Dad4 [Phaffia rhodozyma]|uniref:DASH complex subunit DAD4 n=1 Tax=Phaffia rhodozyma TaxID=264483 RepID=A0A0F7STA6_PHARH|nr:DASH complex subunit Dad4 [Phaffia rhodozyma]